MTIFNIVQLLNWNKQSFYIWEKKIGIFGVSFTLLRDKFLLSLLEKLMAFFLSPEWKAMKEGATPITFCHDVFPQQYQKP